MNPAMLSICRYLVYLVVVMTGFGPAQAATVELYGGTGVNKTHGEQWLLTAQPFEGKHARHVELGVWRYHDRTDDRFTDGRWVVDRYGRLVLVMEAPTFETFSALAGLVGYRVPLIADNLVVSGGLVYFERTSRSVDEGLAAYVALTLASPPFTSACARLLGRYQHGSHPFDADQGIDGVFIGLQIPLGRCVRK